MTLTGHERHAQLLRDLHSGKMKLDEVLKECAYWFCDLFDQMRIQPYPTPPAEYAEYEQMSLSEKSKVPKEFWWQPHIKQYTEVKQKIRESNLSLIENLKEHRKHIPQEDFVTQEKFREKLHDCEERFLSINTTYKPWRQNA